MKKSKYIFLVSIILLLCVVGVAHTQDIPPRPDPPRLVNDFATLLSSTQQQSLEYKLRNYYDTTSTQIVVVTVRSLGNWPINEFSYTIGDQWGVGQAGKDNGIIITIAEKERKTYIATGRGTEGAVTDIHAHRIVNNVMLPQFRNGQFYIGLDQASSALIELLSGEYVPDPADYDDDFSMGFIIFIIVILFMIFVISKANDNRGGGSIGGGGWRGPVVIGSPGSFGGGGSSGGFGGFGGGSFGGGGAGGSW